MTEKIVLRRELIPDSTQHHIKGLSFSNDNGWIVCDFVDQWNSDYPFDLETAFAILSRDLPPPIRIEFNTSSCMLSVSAAGILNDSRTLYPYNKRAGPGHIEVADVAQCNGTAKHLLRNQIEFFFASGQYSHSSIRASSSVGGYTWARFGYLPENVDFEFALKAQVRERLTAIAPLLTPEEMDHINVHKGLHISKDIWGIADADFDLRDRLADATPQFMGVLLGTFAYIDRAETLDRIFERVASGKKLSLGQYLLLGTTWDGEIDFNNVEQMKRVDAYTGGFRYIAFENI